MSSNRLTGFFTDRRPARSPFEIAGPRQSAVPQQAFAVCPVALIPLANTVQLNWQMSIYRLAYEQAQAAVAAQNRAHESAYLWN